MVKKLKVKLWHYGYFWESPDGKCWIKQPMDKLHSADFEVIPETVGQYIGLRDKNKVKIYRGDVLKVLTPSLESDNECEVEWDNESSAYLYEPKRCDGDWDMLSIGYAMKEGYIFEINGNFWENPELRKEKINVKKE